MIIKMSANWCQPCKLLSETLKKIGVEYKECDIDDHAQLVAKYNVRSVPTMLYLDGENLLGVLIGNKSEKQIKDWIEECENAVA